MNDRRNRKKDRTRRALLDAALALYQTRGIYDVRVEDITEAADLGKGSFYNYFEGRSSLLAALLGEILGRLAERCEQALEGTGDPGQRIVRLIGAQVGFLEENPAHPLLIHQARGLLLINSSAADRLRSVFRNFLLRVGRLLHPGENPAEAENLQMEAAALFAGAIAGYRSFMIASGASPNASTLEDFFFNGFSPPQDHSRAGSITSSSLPDGKQKPARTAH